MPTPVDPAIPSAPYCVLTLGQVDELENHAHRILLFGTLVTNGLDDYTGQDRDQILEGFQVLVSDMITHAQGIKAVLDQAQAGRVTENDGA